MQSLGCKARPYTTRPTQFLFNHGLKLIPKHSEFFMAQDGLNEYQLASTIPGCYATQLAVPMAINLGFQTKYILNPWCMLFHHGKILLKVFSISFKIHLACCAIICTNLISHPHFVLLSCPLHLLWRCSSKIFKPICSTKCSQTHIFMKLHNLQS